MRPAPAPPAKRQQHMQTATEKRSPPSLGREDKLINGPSREIHQWISKRSGLVWVEDFLGIARVVDGKIVAAFGYDHHQDASCLLHTASDTQFGYNRTLLRYAFHVPFVQWNYKNLIGIAQVGNLKSNNIATRLGFKEFAILPDAHPSGGLRFSVMSKDSCRWLVPTRSYK